ncbi:unnamed protein product [Diamesa hyperborea]
MADEYFYGATLTGANAEVKWDPADKEEECLRANKLIVKQILLGMEAKADEFNVVEVQTVSKDGEIKIPIAVLKVGENRMAQSFLEFPDAPVTFKLISGTGPVHIHGQHLLGDYDLEEMDEGDFEDELESDEKEDFDENPKKKMKLSTNNVKCAKNDKKKK